MLINLNVTNRYAFYGYRTTNFRVMMDVRWEAVDSRFIMFDYRDTLAGQDDCQPLHVVFTGEPDVDLLPFSSKVIYEFEVRKAII